MEQLVAVRTPFVLAQSLAFIEDQIVDFWYRERMTFLSALYGICAHRHLPLADPTLQFFARYLDSLIAKQNLVRVLLNDYREAGLVTSPYLTRHPTLHAAWKRCWPSWNRKSRSCRSKSASVAA